MLKFTYKNLTKSTKREGIHTLETADLIALRANHRSLSLKQLLQRLRIDASLAAIDRCKDDLALECWADTLGVTAPADALQAALTRFRRARKLLTTAQTNEWLERHQMTLEELTGLLRPPVLRQRLAEQVVADEEIRLHFLEIAQQLDRAEISVLVTKEYGAAQELRFRTEEGAEFHALARQYSADAATAKAGGYMGLVGRADLEPETAAAVFHAPAGAVLGPFERKYGYSLILVEGLYPAEWNEAVAADLRASLFARKLEAYRQTLGIREEIWA